MKLKLLFSFLILFGGSHYTIAQNRTIAGVQFPAKMKVDEKTVIYNGGGLREKYTLDLYVGALYLKRPSMDASLIIEKDEEMVIRIEIVSSKVTRDKFVESVKEGFEKSNTGKSTQKEIDAFMKFYADPFKIGDVISIIYRPGKGTEFYKNGKLRGTLGGLPFKKALFGIWLGDKPADSSLKDEMLGKV